MVIKLLPEQIPKFWEVIKFATVNAEEVDPKDRGTYLVELLHSLLNNKRQCFVRLDDDRKLVRLLITTITVNKITDEKTLFLMPLYSWEKIGEFKDEDFSFLVNFATQSGCRYIAFESRNPKIWNIAESLGLKEGCRIFEFDLGGV